MTVNTAAARYEGLGKSGKGHISTRSNALDNQPYGFQTRFEDKAGTNPEELIAAAHSACFTMALSFKLADAGYADGQIDTKAAVTLEKDGDGFSITRSDLAVIAQVSGISEEDFGKIAEDAKANCPISKLLNAEIAMEWKLHN